MSVLGRQLISRFCVTNIKNSIPLAVTARFNGKVAQKKQDVEDSSQAIPEPVPGLIQSAVLKKYGSPLVIENAETPKNLKSNEVSSYCKVESVIAYFIFYPFFYSLIIEFQMSSVCFFL